MRKYKSITELSRELRRNQTEAEKKLWENIRGKKINGKKFLRQHAIVYGMDHNRKKLFFIADFYCAEENLVIELDGKIHDFQKDYDENRDKILNKLGLEVLRFKNEDIEKDVFIAVNKITEYIKRKK